MLDWTDAGLESLLPISSSLEILVRLDGVVYLLGGHPLEARRRVEGPAFFPGDDDAAGLDGDDRELDDYIPVNPVEDVDDPIVATIVLRPARLSSSPLALGPFGSATEAALGAAPRDRMDETSDRLCAIDEKTGLIILEIGTEWYLRPVRVASRSRMVVPMQSGVNVRRDTTVQVTARPQVAAFRPQRIIIGGTPADWVVNDIRIGNRSQFAQSGHLPGEMFATTAIDSFVLFETVQPSMDLALIATYIGEAPEGAPLIAGIVGDEIVPEERSTRLDHVLTRRSAARWTPGGRLQGWMIGLTGEDENRDFAPGEPPRAAAAHLDGGDVEP